MGRLSQGKPGSVQDRIRAFYLQKYANVARDTDVLDMDSAKEFVAFCYGQSCGKCSVCRLGLPHMLNVLEAFCNDGVNSTDAVKLAQVARAVYEASECSVGFEPAYTVLASLPTWCKDEQVTAALHAGVGASDACAAQDTQAAQSKASGCVLRDALPDIAAAREDARVEATNEEAAGAIVCIPDAEALVTVQVDGREVSVAKGSSLIAACAQAGVTIPTLCMLPEVATNTACRVCLVEVEGIARLVPACATQVRQGMRIATASPRVIATRQSVVALLLSDHDAKCTSCVRNGSCALQKLAASVGVRGTHVDKRVFPVMRDSAKCIHCFRCVTECSSVQGCNVWAVKEAPSPAIVMRDKAGLAQSGCVACGQCITHCPTGALSSREDIDEVLCALANPRKTVVANIAPAARTSWAEELGLSPKQATPQTMVSAALRMGFARVYDIDFGADLTIMEESAELLEYLRVQAQEETPDTLPLFTSCCPAWVQFAKTRYPQLIGCISTSKSPIGMQAALEKTYLADDVLRVPREDVVVVSIMPCVAKKAEAGRKELWSGHEVPDVDISLTVREFVQLVKRFGISVADLPETEFDSPFAFASGGGHLFGRTGGVMEAAIRNAARALQPEADTASLLDAARMVSFTPASQERPWAEKVFELPGCTLRAAVVSGLGNARVLIDALLAKEVFYDFVEVMACPGGCVGGGGQPIAFNEERAHVRAQVLEAIDAESDVRVSSDNQAIQSLYEDFLGKVGGLRATELLHVARTEER